MELVIVRERRAWVQCLYQRAMQAVSILRAASCSALAQIIEEIPQCLICDKQPEQLPVAMLRQDAKKRRTQRVVALLAEGVQCVFPERSVWNDGRPRSPIAKLA
jgi:hypothetical protein